MSTTAKRHFIDLLTDAGIEVDGTRPWDIQVHDERLYGRLLAYGTLGFGEAYMDGWWDARRRSTSSSSRLLELRHLRASASPICGLALSAVRGAAAQPAARSRVSEVGEQHYDIGNDLYEAMLDRRMIYTCGYWARRTRRSTRRRKPSST